MERSDRLSLSYVMAAQAQKHVTVNETTRALDALLHMNVLSQTVTAEPATPALGDGYILPVGKTGAAWDSLPDLAVAVYQDNAWMAYTPVEGMIVYLKSASAHVAWDGAAWSEIFAGVSSSSPEFGVNASADATNKLTVKSDAVLFSHDDITPGSGDMRHVLNKIQDTATASILFQNSFSARAEFGLTGTDDFTIKVSPDGQNFFDAIVIDRATGAVSFPNTQNLGGGNPAFVPSDIADLAAWWDPSDSANITADGAGLISQLTDKSGAGIHALQTTPAEQPLLAAGGLANRDGMQFSGGQLLAADGLANIFSGDDSAYSVHIVFQASQNASTQIPFGVGNSADATKGVWVGVHSSGAYRLSKRSSGTADVDITESNSQAHILSIVYTGTAATFWLDGVLVKSLAPQDVADMPVDRVALGAWVRTSTAFHFEGLIGEVIAYSRANSDAEIRQLQRYLGDRWLGLPAQADVFLAMGQSNMMGKGDAVSSPIVAPGIGFEWSDNGFFQSLIDPAGPADTGSCLPSFANAWHSDTGRAAFMVNAALGSTSLLPEADGGFGNWHKTQGTLYNTAVSTGNTALSSLNTNSIFTITGVYGLWAQGERDAAILAAGTAGVTAAAYETALTTLITDLGADLSTAPIGFYIFELGAQQDGSQETSWAAIRGAQNNVATANAITAVVFSGAKGFSAAGLMAGPVHYTQAGYNQMGTDGGTFAAGLNP